MNMSKKSSQLNYTPLQITVKPMSERPGMYYPDGSHKTENQIRREQGNKKIEITPDTLPSDVNFKQWVSHFKDIQQWREALHYNIKHVDIAFPDDEPRLIVPIGDAHIGGDCDYDMLEDDVMVAKETKNAHVLLVGDIVNGLFFKSGATQDNLTSLNNEVLAAQSMMSELKRGGDDKILVAWGGQHDHDWASDRSISMYYDFKEKYNAHFLHGIAYVDFHFPDYTFSLVGSHKGKGRSIRDDGWPAKRMHSEDGPSCDISLCADAHGKYSGTQTVRDKGGSKDVLYQVTGPYQKSSPFFRKVGFGDKDGRALGATSFILYPNGDKQGFWTVREGVRVFESL